jgi:hypothetical protein
MENKYFTPDIEDLCIGYECEYNFARAYTDEFDFVKIGYKDVTPGKGGYTNELTHMIHLIDDGAAAIRVPYLTKEQIEAEGWKFDYNLGDFDYYIKTVNNTEYELEFCYKERININIWKRTLYHGECKDINTFRKIIKLLNIK